MSDWHVIEGAEPDQADFPLRTQLDGERIVVFRDGDKYWAVQRQCPHQNTDFSRGSIVGGTMLRCGLHSYTFKLSDGSGVNCPGYKINVWEVKRDGGQLMARPITAD